MRMTTTPGDGGADAANADAADLAPADDGSTVPHSETSGTSEAEQVDQGGTDGVAEAQGTTEESGSTTAPEGYDAPQAPTDADVAPAEGQDVAGPGSDPIAQPDDAAAAGDADPKASDVEADADAQDDRPVWDRATHGEPPRGNEDAYRVVN
jgi:hypothetical protein